MRISILILFFTLLSFCSFSQEARKVRAITEVMPNDIFSVSTYELEDNKYVQKSRVNQTGQVTMGTGYFRIKIFDPKQEYYITDLDVQNRNELGTPGKMSSNGTDAKLECHIQSEEYVDELFPNTKSRRLIINLGEFIIVYHIAM